ncbi:twin-arginine translocase subunit TatC [Paenibacillus sambharensis]|uniref:twin-arginine translocase subunit TatC n=1 Tax=Paenibacillus sambharensis TaxID=1803190 RepID=UPI00267AE3F7
MAGPNRDKLGGLLSDEHKLMSLMEHIGELRKRLLAVGAVLVLGLIGGLVAAQPIYEYLTTTDQAKDLALHAFSFWDGIGLYMKFALVTSLVLVIPFGFYQLWAFIKPALEPREQRATLRYVPFALLMFLAGLAFSYFVVFPLAFGFTRQINEQLGLEETYGVIQYFTFMFNIVIPIALLFELPIVIMFLTRLGILNPVRLRKMRRLAYFLLVFIGVLVTPPDVVSDLLVIFPLILLYEFSVYLSVSVYRRMERDRASAMSEPEEE